jgi:hypothetical protein
MKRLYHFGILGATFIFLIVWILNCTGIEVTPAPQTLLNLNTDQVVFSDWINADQWVSTSVFGLPARACELTNKTLNNSTLDNSQLYVYSKIDDEVHPMPFNINVANTELRFDYTIPKTSTLRIVMIGLKGQFSPIGKQKYRYVLIPNSLVKKSLINMGDYETVKAAFHLED